MKLIIKNFFQKYIKKLVIVCIFLFSFFVFFNLKCLAFVENFDSYSVGNLNGQGDWIPFLSYNSLYVSSLDFNSSPNSIRHSSTSWQYSKLPVSFPATGSLYFLFKGNDVDDSSFATVVLGADLCFFFINSTTTPDILDIKLTGGNSSFIFSEVTTNDWHVVQIEYNTLSSSENCRFRIDFGDWSSWLLYYSSKNIPTYFRVGVKQYTSGFISFDDFGTSITPPLSFTSPVEGSFLSSGATTTFSGTCPDNGVKNLFLTYLSNINCSSYSSFYNVSCINNSWSLDYNVYSGNREMFIYDSDCNSDSITYTGLDSTDYFLSIIYPEYTSSGYFNLYASDDWTFRFQYTALDTSTTTFYFQQCNSDYSTCGDYYNNSIEFFDPGNLGYIDVENVIASSTQILYYRAGLSQNDIVKFAIDFKVKGDNDDTLQQPGDPDTFDMGFWGRLFYNLFIPNKNTIIKFWEDFPDLLEQKIPFYYFYQIKSEIDSFSVVSTTLQVSFDIPVGGTTTTFPVLDSSDSTTSSFFSMIRPYINYFLYIVLAFGILASVINLKL